MKSNNESIPDLMSDVERGVMQLPRFQRNWAWTPERTKKFLGAVLDRYPLGALLLLEVNSNNPPFKIKPIEGTVVQPKNCRTNLLDGQQRMTALLKALNDSDELLTYYVEFSKNDTGKYAIKGVEHYNKQKPWYRDPVKEYEKELLPFAFLKPGEETLSRANQWKSTIADKMKWDSQETQQLDTFIHVVREIISHTSIPCLVLPQDMGTDVVIEIFKSINTSSVKLTAFEIANALCEKKVSESLHEYIGKLQKTIPKLSDLIEKKKRSNKGLGDVVLRMACMDQGKAPQEGNYEKLNYEKLLKRLPDYTKGFQWAETLLMEEGILDETWLPSKAPIRVLPLIHSIMNDLQLKRHDLDKARRLIRAYLWRSFTTEWYTKMTNGRIHKDFGILKQMLEKKQFDITKFPGDVIFNEAINPLPSKDKVKEAVWPKSQNVLTKSILAAVIVKGGPLGLETGERKSKFALDGERHYHHVYPRALLLENGIDPDVAMNCILIEGRANQSWNKLWPGDWLDKTAKRIGANGKDMLIERLRTHTLPVETLLAARKESGKLKDSYEEYLDERAEMVHHKLNSLCKTIFVSN